MRNTGDQDGLVVLLHAVDVDAIGQLLDQFTEQVNRQVAVSLQIFHCCLAGPQCGNLRLQGRNILDLPFKTGDFRFQEVVFRLLAFNLSQIPGVHSAGNQHARQRGNAQGRIKHLAPAFARSLPVREQIDQNHCTNLRKARPQDVK